MAYRPDAFGVKGSALRTKFTADDFMGASTPEGSVIPANISGDYLAPSKRAQDAAAGIVSPLAQAERPQYHPGTAIQGQRDQMPGLMNELNRQNTRGSQPVIQPVAPAASPVTAQPAVQPAREPYVSPFGTKPMTDEEYNALPKRNAVPASPLQTIPLAPGTPTAPQPIPNAPGTQSALQPLQTSQIPGDWDGMNNMQLAQAGAVDNAAERLTGRERQLRELEDATVSGQPLPASPAETYQAPKKPPPSFLERFFKKEPKKQPLQTAYSMNPTAGIRG